MTVPSWTAMSPRERMAHAAIRQGLLRGAPRFGQGPAQFRPNGSSEAEAVSRQ
jgi:hypothetical protein